MSTEFGLFSDEGLIESGFYSIEEARSAIATRYSPDDELTVEEMCPCGSDEPRSYCEECDGEEENEDEEEEDE